MYVCMSLCVWIEVQLCCVQRLRDGGSALVVDRPDKEQVIFYRDPNLDLQVDEGEERG